MLLEEVPKNLIGVERDCRGAQEKQLRGSAWPGVAASLEPVENNFAAIESRGLSGPLLP